MTGDTVLDQKIMEYVEALFAEAESRSRQELHDERVKALRPTSGSLPLGGVEIGRTIQAHANHIERAMDARLEAFKQAFARVSRNPSSDEITDIWQDISFKYDYYIKGTSGVVRDFLKARGSDGDPTESIRSASGHGHDRVLNKWKVWRAEAALQPVRKGAMRTHVTGNTPYRFHEAIEDVSRDLYEGGHFKQAVFEALVCVIGRVKQQSGIPDMDGEKLMNHVFGSDSGPGPKIRFNAYSNEPEKDEQRGFMNLFKGIVGIRNFKAHTNVLFDSPERAHEYLALASLLMRLLDVAFDLQRREVNG
jgi:uncharacterized protein (TIGR02391 family)